MKKVLSMVLLILMASTVFVNSVNGATTLYLNQPSDSDVSESSVRLQWSKTQDWLFLRYEVWIDDGENLRIVTEIDDYDVTYYTVKNLDQDTEYSFYIKDVDSVGSADSNVVVVRTDVEPEEDDNTDDQSDDELPYSDPYAEDDLPVYPDDDEDSSETNFLGMSMIFISVFFIGILYWRRGKRVV